MSNKANMRKGVNWSQNGTIVTNANITLEVGSRITGYEAKGISNWYVLGAKDGELLITTKSCPKKVELRGKDGYLNGVEILNDAVKDIYDDGIFADIVRPIDVEDINRVTGCDPKTASWHPGNQLLPRWPGCRRLDNKEIMKLPSTLYWYVVRDFLAESSKAYKLLFGGSQLYWLSSSCSYWASGDNYLGLRTVEDGCVSFERLACTNYFEHDFYFGLRMPDDGLGYSYTDYSLSNERGYDFGVRPVVFLKSEVQVDSDGVISICV